MPSPPPTLYREIIDPAQLREVLHKCEALAGHLRSPVGLMPACRLLAELHGHPLLMLRHDRDPVNPDGSINPPLVPFAVIRLRLAFLRVWMSAGIVWQENARGEGAWLPPAGRGNSPLVDDATLTEFEAATRGAAPLAEQASPAAPATAEQGGAVEEVARALALIDSTAARIHAIASDTSKAADQRMRDIYALDRGCLGWDSGRWAALLVVSGSAVRKTDWWKQDRPRLRGRD
jgi:hypothetical protein